MNSLTKDLENLTKRIEEQADGNDIFRQKLHLMPPVGWLNDPNGLCQFKGIYHAFFQYSPFCAEGGLKMWGHYHKQRYGEMDLCRRKFISGSAL